MEVVMMPKMLLWGGPSFVLSCILTLLAIKLGITLNVMDHPIERKIHKKPVPRTGGWAIVSSLILCIILFAPINRLVIAYLSGLFIIVAFGITDDVLKLNPNIKFVGQIFAVIVFSWISEILLYNLGNIFGFGDVYSGILAWPLTIFCMVGVINAINMIDGLDGLAAGVTIILSGFIVAFSMENHKIEVAMIAVILIGCAAGFLCYNFHPAKLFMGDGGSLALGYTLAVLAVTVTQTDGEADTYVRPISMAILFALPVADAIVVMILRRMSAHKATMADRRHLHYRLETILSSHKKAVLLLWGVTLFFGLWAWMLRMQAEYIQFYITVMLIIAGYWYLYYFERKRKGGSSLVSC